MRRTTICRSSRAAVLALAALPLLWRVLPAQDTTKTRDTTQAVQPQDTTQAAAAFQGQVPSSHTVSRGETLWSIAQMYFSDPLLWPEIYRLNTAVIEDPHWIYPGEVLHIGSVVAVAQAPESAAVAPADTVRAQADTVTAIAPDTSTAFDTAGVVEAPPPAATDAYETIFERRRTPREQVKRVLRAYSNPL